LLFMTVRHIFEISEGDHPRLVTHARDHWWTLDFSNASLSAGVNSRAELVPSPLGNARNGAPRRWLGDYIQDLSITSAGASLHQNKVKQQIPNIFQSKYQQKFTGNNYTDRCAENIGLTMKSFRPCTTSWNKAV
jgi:hypothetical protein